MQRCSNCGEENTDRARFCSSCGAALTAPATQAEERKVVSVLFADLVGFTSRSERADPEDVRATLGPYHARLKREIQRYGGTVEKFIGDAVMAVFGAPVSREDDAERAVRAGLRILEEIPALNEEHPGLDLAVRVAVNTGEGLVNVAARADRGESLVTGDVVNTAARLQTVAPIGGLVVGEPTYRATRDLFDYESLEPVSLKGKAEPAPLWQALRARAGFRRGVDAAGATPFVGRDLEQTMLQQAHLRTVRERAVQLVTVTGEPGVGKSRLIHEFFGFIDDQPDIVWWRHGRCLPYGEGVSFWALGEIVKAQAGILESDDARTVEDKIAAAVAFVADDATDRDWMAARLGSLVGVSDEVPADRGELFAAWRSFLEALASSRPLVLIFEDLHWADDAMLDFVEHLVDWSSDVPILVLCTARPELYERHPGWGGGKRNAVTISLSPLTLKESDELVSALLSGQELDAAVRQSLLDRSGGNPLYAEEFVRMFNERGGSNGRDASDVSMPESVHALIAARLDTLPPERKTILHDASVVGRVFWSGAVAHIGGVGDVDVRSGLHDLARKELVRPVRGSSVKDEAEYSFWHALVRDVAYGQIPRGPRSQKHRAAAEWIERLAGERVADHAEVLVHHYREAASLARAAGNEDEASALDRLLRSYLVMAGNRTRQLDARRAYEYFAEALELYPTGDPDRAGTLARAGEVAFEWGDLDAGERLATEAAEQFDRTGDAAGQAKALITVEDVRWLKGEQRSGLLAKAISLLETLPPTVDLADAQGKHGFRQFLQGNVGEGLDWLNRAARLAEMLDEKDLSARVLMARGPARVQSGDPGGVDDLREAVRLALEGGGSRTAEIAQNNLAYHIATNESPAAAVDVYRRAIEFANQRGLEQISEWSASEMTGALYDAGRWDEALETTETLLRPTSRLRQDRNQGILFAAMYRARLLAQRGAAGEEDLIAQFLPRAREVGDLQMLVPALIAASVVEETRSRLDEAVELVDEYEALTDGRPLWRSFELCASVRIQIRAGRLDRARALLAGTRPTWPRDRGSIAGARAAIAEATSGPHEAAALYRAAAEEWERCDHVVEQAFARLGEGRCLLAAGDGDRAAAPLAAARETFERLRAVPLVAQVDALLR